jgi:hypothetical protein
MSIRAVKGMGIIMSNAAKTIKYKRAFEFIFIPFSKRTLEPVAYGAVPRHTDVPSLITGIVISRTEP